MTRWWVRLPKSRIVKAESQSDGIIMRESGFIDRERSVRARDELDVNFVLTKKYQFSKK